MLVRAPLVQTEQHRDVGIADHSEVVVRRGRERLAEQRLVPAAARDDIADAGTCGLSAIGVALSGSSNARHGRASPQAPTSFHERLIMERVRPLVR